MMHAKRYRSLVVLGAVTLSCALAASAVSATGGAAGSSATPSLAKAVSIYSKFVGGKPGKASTTKRPIVVGYVNDEGGIPSFPEGTAAARAAVRFVNEKLGGVRGHPLKLNECLISTGEEQGQGCAQKFLGTKRLGVVVEAQAVVGSQAFHQTLAGKLPVVIAVPISPADATAKNAYAIGSGVFGVIPGTASFAKVVKAKTASLLFPGDDPTGQLAAKNIKEALTKAGIAVTDVGYKFSAPDMLPSVIASGAGRTDVTITLFPSPPSCIAGAKALQQANVTKPTVGLSACIADPVKQALGDYPKMTYIALNTNPSIPGDPSTDAYVRVMKTYAPANANTGGFAPFSFVAVLQAVRALNLSGGAAATPAKIGSVLKAWKGPTPMSPPNVKYGSVPGLPAIPSLQTRLYEYKGNGKWVDVTGGKWVLP
jgi:branched-chain amino acid transport system substrate-binding protein